MMFHLPWYIASILINRPNDNKNADLQWNHVLDSTLKRAERTPLRSGTGVYYVTYIGLETH